MIKKTSKYLMFSSVLLVLSLLLVSCQPMIASTEARDRKQAVEPWETNITAQGERYREEMERLYNGSLMKLSSDVPSETGMMVDASSPGIEIQQIKTAITMETIYTVTSEGPGWVVIHADQDGEPGPILEQIWVNGGTNRIARSEFLHEMDSEPVHVMLHYDTGWTGYFEFPRRDRPVFVNEEIINELCLCSY